MFDFLDQLSGDPSYAPSQSVLPAASAQAQAPTPAASPSALDLMAQGSKPLTLPKGDTSNLLPLTLLQFAASVTQPKQYGQSNMAKFAQSIAGAAAYNMNERKTMEDRAVEQELQKRKIAATDMQLEQARLGNIKSRQDITQNEARYPLELESLRTGIANAKTQGELSALQVRAQQIHSEYTRQEIEAGLREKESATDTHRAVAMMDRSHAQLFAKQAEELVNIAKMRSQAAQHPSYKLKEAMPGDPAQMIEEHSGAVYTQPMSPSDALSYAKRQIAARKEVGEFKDSGSTGEKLALQTEYQKALKGNMPMPGQSPSAGMMEKPAATAAPAAPQQNEMEPEYRKALMDGASKPGSLTAYQDKTGKVTIIKGGIPDKIYQNDAAFSKDWDIVNGRLVRKAGGGGSDSSINVPGRSQPRVIPVGPGGVPMNVSDLPEIRRGSAGFSVNNTGD